MTQNHIRKLTWQQFARSLRKAQVDDALSIRELCDEYNYSIGKIHSYLTLAEALDQFPELDRIEKYSDAVAFIRTKDFHRSSN